jgi:hypothetical protein
MEARTALPIAFVPFGGPMFTAGARSAALRVVVPNRQTTAVAAARAGRPGAMIVCDLGGYPVDHAALADAAGLAHNRFLVDAWGSELPSRSLVSRGAAHDRRRVPGDNHAQFKQQSCELGLARRGWRGHHPA